MNPKTAEAFAPITRAARVRTEGQQHRMDRREAERQRQTNRMLGRGQKRSQAFA